jgi:hypothetical protein
MTFALAPTLLRRVVALFVAILCAFSSGAGRCNISCCAPMTCTSANEAVATIVTDGQDRESDHSGHSEHKGAPHAEQCKHACSCQGPVASFHTASNIVLIPLIERKIAFLGSDRLPDSPTSEIDQPPKLVA